MIGDDLLLEFGLARIGDVLPLAAATGVRRRAEVGAGRRDAIGAWFQHVQEPGARPTIPLLDDLDSYTLARDGVRHEDGLARVPADGLTPVGDGVEVDFDGLRHVCTLLRASYVIRIPYCVDSSFVVGRSSIRRFSPIRSFAFRQVRQRPCFVAAHHQLQCPPAGGGRHVNHLDKVGVAGVAR